MNKGANGLLSFSDVLKGMPKAVQISVGSAVTALIMGCSGDDVPGSPRTAKNAPVSVDTPDFRNGEFVGQDIVVSSKFDDPDTDGDNPVDISVLLPNGNMLKEGDESVDVAYLDDELGGDRKTIIVTVNGDKNDSDGEVGVEFVVSDKDENGRVIDGVSRKATLTVKRDTESPEVGSTEVTFAQMGEDKSTGILDDSENVRDNVSLDGDLEFVIVSSPFKGSVEVDGTIHTYKMINFEAGVDKYTGFYQDSSGNKSSNIEYTLSGFEGEA